MLRPKARKATKGHTPRKRKRRLADNGAGETFGVLLLTVVVSTFVYGVLIPYDLARPTRKPATLTTPYSKPILRRIPEEENRCDDYGCPIYPSEWGESQERIEKLKGATVVDWDESNWTMATMTRRSTRHQPPFNQDAAVIIRPFRTKQTSHPHDFFMGIFDGHGMQGHHVSNYAAGMVPEILQRRFNEYEGIMSEQEIVQVLNETFLETDVRAPPTAMSGGTTATVALRRHGKLYIANTGDSRTIVVTRKSDDDGTAEIPFMTRLDKAHLPEEEARIKASGGSVKYPPGKPGQSRVWVYSSVAREAMGLAMSRSIGDWEWGDVGVIAEPTIDVLDITTLKQAFVLTASDGMWDTRKPQFFANKFAESIHRRLKHPLVACYDVIESISPKNPSFYRDDITMIVMKLLPD